MRLNTAQKFFIAELVRANELRGPRENLARVVSKTRVLNFREIKPFLKPMENVDERLDSLLRSALKYVHAERDLAIQKRWARRKERASLLEAREKELQEEVARISAINIQDLGPEVFFRAEIVELADHKAAISDWAIKYFGKRWDRKTNDVRWAMVKQVHANIPLRISKHNVVTTTDAVQTIEHYDLDELEYHSHVCVLCEREYAHRHHPDQILKVHSLGICICPDCEANC